MKIVIDTNVIITYFWKNNVAKEIFNNTNLQFYTPEFALEEINKHSEIIMKKARINESDFLRKKIELTLLIDFVPEKIYQKYLKVALKECPDANDIDFVGLALKLDCPIWSNDKILKKGKGYSVLNTKELIEITD